MFGKTQILDLALNNLPGLDFTAAFHYFCASAPSEVLAGGFCRDKLVLGQPKSTSSHYFTLPRDGGDPKPISITDFRSGPHNAFGIIGHAVFQAIMQLEKIDEDIADRSNFCLLLRRHAILLLGLPLKGIRQNLYIPSPLASGHECLADPDVLNAEFKGRLRLAERTKDGKTA